MVILFVGLALCLGGAVVAAKVAKVRRQKKLNEQQLIRVAIEHSDVGRRLAIYDQQTGFLAPWYFSLRSSEEISRSQRYACSLSLLKVSVNDEARSRLQHWLHTSLRLMDLVCPLGSGVFLVMLPETDEVGATVVAKRIFVHMGAGEVSLATLPGEQERFDALMAPAMRPGTVESKAAA